MTNLQTMTTAELLDVLEGIDDAESNYGLMLAEAGSGGVSLGYDGYDAMHAWAAENPPTDYSAERAVIEAELDARADVDAGARGEMQTSYPVDLDVDVPF